MGDLQRSAEQYDAMAASYVADNANGPYNAYYERPATIALLGEVRGRRVLDAGCGPGVLTAWLVDHGAAVRAFDVSEQMVALARAAVRDRAEVVVADLAQPLSFVADSSVDIVVASLVLHYVRDWHHVLSELRRVLVPGGMVVCSTHHPAMDWEHSPDDYYATVEVTERWRKGSAELDVTFWRRPLGAMTAAFASCGFVIEQLVEPEPLPELRERDAAAYERLRTNPTFLCFRLRAER